MTRPELEAHIRAIDRRCRGPLPRAAREAIVRLLEEGQPEKARYLDAAARRPCGYDFNQIILAGSLDGQEHVYRCPGCGVTGTYRAPRAEELSTG